MKKILFVLFINSLFYSCVPYKKIIYLQGEMPEKNDKQKEYIIKKNDILSIEVFSLEEAAQKLLSIISANTNTNNVSAASLFFKGYTVDNEGFIDIPIIHKIQVAGKTYNDVKQLIIDKLAENNFKNTNNLTVKVKIAGIPYTVLGEVKSPQSGVLYKENPTLLDVLGQAGDISLVGDKKHIYVIRNEGGKTVKVNLDLTKANVVSSPYFYIRPNDIVYVQPLRQKTLGTGTTLQQTISTTITALSLITTIILLSKYTK